MYIIYIYDLTQGVIQTHKESISGKFVAPCNSDQMFNLVHEYSMVTTLDRPAQVGNAGMAILYIGPHQWQRGQCFQENHQKTAEHEL